MSTEDLSPQKDEVQAPKPQSFFARIFSVFSGGNDPEREKKRQLKDIEKQLKKAHYKFYKPRGEEVLPGLAKFFHEIYQVVGPVQLLIQHAESSGVLKNIIIETYLTDVQIELKERLTEEAIRERVKTTETKQLSSEIKEELVTFFSAFDNQKVKEINATYNLLSVFLDLVHFDYYFFLKKFDSGMPERDFVYHPKFEAINGEYVSEDLKEFSQIMALVDREADWDRLFDILKCYRNVEVISRQNWRKVLQSIRNVRKDGILSLIIKHLDKDPFYKGTVKVPNEKIVEPYLTKIKTQTELSIQKILQEKRNSKIEMLTKNVFGTTAVSRMKNYTEKTNLMFSKKMLGGFTYIAPLNYLKAFLLDYFKKDVREIVNLLLIKGQWTTNLTSQQLSESFHHIMSVSEELLKFDDSVGEEGILGSKLRTALKRSDRDKNSVVVVRQILKEINDKAKAMIDETAQNLIFIGKVLKSVLEDYKADPHEILLNWKEIDLASENKVTEVLTELYKKLYYFVQLLQIFVKSAPSQN